ncbi:hypothetical protein [Burkholderia cenocepacia]|uniref:hypothetical protein n=1 Tax=Burkholderia cenocepacia TaxID=95486 RepID=UPI000760DE1F|nr:hypothetical protein [Burkholderia cenocepacia]KWU26374.1 hypothetical protein AS149_25635 [Burkholderia cenocepacia]
MPNAHQLPFVSNTHGGEKQLFQKVLDALEASAYHSDLDLPAPDVQACGVYALYYRGNRRDYHLWATHFKDQPIFVGHGTDVLELLREHYDHFDQVINLTPEEFLYRAVALESASPFANTENGLARALVEHYQPLWNDVIQGFVPNAHFSSNAGNLPLSAARKQQATPEHRQSSTLLYDILDCARAMQKRLGRFDVPEGPFRDLEELAASGQRPD